VRHVHDDHDTVVFLGPSLPVAEARPILPARYEPPARLGSIYEVIGSEVATILLVDGVFHNEPSVWQREVDAALQAGMVVFGASSMGALRAAELHRFGMIGHGVVFDWYHQQVIEDDDEVALVHGDMDSGYRALSEPMVNIRATLQRAVDDRVIPVSMLARTVETAKRVYYPQRSFSRLVADLRADHELAAFAEPLERYIASHRIDIKRRDAISLLELVADLRRRGEGATPVIDELRRRDPFVVRSSHGHAQLRDMWRRRGQEYRQLDHEGRQWTLGEVWKLVEAGPGTVEVPDLGGRGSIAISPAIRTRLASDRALRDLATEHARIHGLVTPKHHRERVMERLRTAIAAAPRAHPYAEQPDAATSAQSSPMASGADGAILRWIRACRITWPELEERLAAEAVVAWFTDELPAEVVRWTTDWSDPLAGTPDPTADVGLYFRVFSTHAERLACRRVALAAMLDMHDHEVEPVPAGEWSRLVERAGQETGHDG
jgi:hypothetical protein